MSRLADRPEMDALLGIMPDTDLARRLGMPSVSGRHSALKIPVANTVAWAPAVGALLGNISNSQRALKLGCTRYII
jgi:hypothetical protein